MPGISETRPSFDRRWKLLVSPLLCAIVLVLSGNSLSQQLSPSHSVGNSDQKPPERILCSENLFEMKHVSITRGRSVELSIADTSETTTFESTDSTVAIVRGKNVIGINRGSAEIVAKQTASGSTDTLSVSVVPWIAGASSLVVDKVEPYFRGLGVRGDTVFMQSWGGPLGGKQLYQYVSSTDQMAFLYQFPSNWVEPEYLLPTPFGNFDIARRESASALRKVYRSTCLLDEPEWTASIFGPDDSITTYSYVLQQGWSYDASGNVYVGEYLGQDDVLPDYQVKILKGADFGTHWDTAYTFPGRNIKGRDGGVRHVHACQVDPYTGDIWIGTGDVNDQSRIYNHTNQLLPDPDGTVRLNLVGVGSQEFRVVSFAFTENYIYWFMDAPTSDQKIFRVRRRDSYPTLTPEMPKEDDYREVVATLPDKPLYNNIKAQISGGEVTLVSSVYENAPLYGTGYHELDTCVRVFASREYADNLVQVQEVFAARSLDRWGEVTPIGQDPQGNIFFKTSELEAAGESAVYRTHLIWQDAQLQVVAPGPSETVQFPIVGLTFSGTVDQGGTASVIFRDAPPSGHDLPPGVSAVSPFYWDAQAYGLSLEEGKVSISLSKLSSLGDPSLLVILQESADGDRWENLGGEVIENEFVSTVPVSAIGPLAVGLLSGPLAVQIARIKATSSGNLNVRLDWETVSEVSNYGFEVQGSKDAAGPYVTVPNSFVAGNGTSNQHHKYSIKVHLPNAAMKWLRLKQTDLDGAIHYSEGVLPDGLDDVARNLVPTEFSLGQNFPNPFNPTTTIRYGIPRRSHVLLTVYNTLGECVAQLVDGDFDAGYHETRVDGSNLASGVYYYRLQARQIDRAQSGSFVETKKFVLLR